ncbi:Rhizobiocin/RTX toxin and hemolysin-type calcium binding protein [Azotobacter chroococcum NCIMB 8003]|uniref:Rhizobiocin/RTX toxin and hemolysin-type calcium binding protein n=1 Tax=Azotobacter chroococcum NCIMB 8003 TaxID=1328314 RepID=A0A0C4WRW4_9GAMM|nr:Rhizobiocin/RTX toxin and hemolysin-type calcium binding protein [Azotobacter chroococcum NCIMB 8003]
MVSAAAKETIDVSLVMDGLKQDFQKLADALGNAYTEAVDALSNALSEASDFVGGLRDWAIDQLSEFLDWWDPLAINDDVNSNFISALEFIPRSDPLTLDIDGDGIETVSADTGIVFDFDGDGLKTGTGWIKGDDGFLVRDLDGNGSIDNGGELFGVDTVKRDGSKAKDGFDALRDLDSNVDGVFDARDEHFSSVRVWQDLNQDGVSQANELKSLLESNIASINLTAQSSRQTSNDNIISAVGSYVRLDGTEGEVNANQSLAANLDLASNPFYREYTDRIELSEEVAALPDMKGSGAVRDLQEAAMLDAGLRNVLAEYSQATTREQQLALIDKLLAEWASSSDFRTFDQRVSDLNTELGYLDVEFEFVYSWDKPASGLSFSSGGSGPGSGRIGGISLGGSEESGPTAEQLEKKALLERIKALEIFNAQNFFNFGKRETLNENGESDVSIQLSSGATSRNSGGGIQGIAFGSHTIYLTEEDLTVNSGQSRFLNSSYEALHQSVYDGLLLQTRLKPYMDAVSLTFNENGIGFDFSQVDSLFQTRYDSAPAEAICDLLDLQRVRGVDLAALGWEGLGQLNQWLNEALGGPNEAAVLAALADFGYSGIRLQGEEGNGNDVVISDANGGVLQGLAGNDLVLGGAGNDTLSGGTGSDTLYGGKGSDVYRFNLRDGHDVIIESLGEADSNVIEFGPGIRAGDINISLDGNNLLLSHINGRDSLTVANWLAGSSDSPKRIDTVRFADGRSFDLSAMQFGSAGDDSLVGTDGNDMLMAGAGNDSLEGGAGDDWLDGGTGADSMAGGEGNDTYVVDNALDVVVEELDGGVDTVESKVSYVLGDNLENLSLLGAANLDGTGNALDNQVVGNDGDNRLLGLEGNDVLVGNYGNDLLDGGAGDDTMLGGIGNDTYVVDSLGDSLSELANQGKDTVQSSIDYTLGAHLENLVLTGEAHLSGTGNELANVITGNTGDNLLSGEAGNDTLEGGAGNDRLLGGDGNDRLDGGSGADLLVGGLGNDTYVVDDLADIVVENPGEGIDTVQSSITYTLTADVENLTLTGAASIDGTGNELDNAITGNDAANTLLGLAGNDVLDGGKGADTLIGGVGNDTYGVDNAGDQVVENEGEGNDTVRSSITYRLGAHLENLELTGSDAIDGTGNELDNSLIGNSGSNELDGGLGADSMAGGHGDDTYVLDNHGDSILEHAGQGIDTVVSPFDYVLGAKLENLILTGTAITGTGNELDNILVGNELDNVLTGLGGDDTYVVQSVGDRIVEQVDGGIDTVQSSVAWTLGENLENLTLTGDTAIDGTGNELDNVLQGNSGANVLMGLEGDDVLNGGAGADVLIGGTGNDTYMVDDAADEVVELAGEGVDTVKASIDYQLIDSLENLELIGSGHLTGTGNQSDNVLVGNDGNNILYGLEGNDTLNGDKGADTLVGGIGDDAYIVDSAADVVVEQAGEGLDSVHSSVSYALSANVENLTLTDTAAIDGTGNELDNLLVGNAGNNRVDGGAGADVMQGGAGNDSYVIDHADDTVVELAGEGVDTVTASVDYTLTEHVENLKLAGDGNLAGTGNALGNVITGNGGDNILLGMEGVDRLYGGAGNDLLDGGSDRDLMVGGTGDDTYVIDNAGDMVSELSGEGTDTVQSSISYMLGSHLENLILTGAESLDGTGNALDNQLTGNLGNNVLDGAAGADTMAGGAGDDTYVVDNAADVVVENAGEGLDTVRASIDYRLTDHVENLVLTGSSDLSATGNALDNQLTGNSGDNLLDGGMGADTMAGGDGDDTYVVDDAGDLVIEQGEPVVASFSLMRMASFAAASAPAGGIDTVRAGIDYTLTDNVESLILTGTADLKGTGNSLDNIITGNSGTDTLAGLGGDDTYVVDSSADVVIENADEGIDTVQSSADYVLSEHVENLTLTGSEHLHGTGNELDNIITGNSGDNVLDGSVGADTMLGGAGDDTYIVDNAADTLVEQANEGVDLAYSSVSYTLAANVENLILTGAGDTSGTGNELDNVVRGNVGNNRLFGMAGNDTLIDDAGDDLLDGGSGADSLAGGVGDDTYVVDNAGDVVIEHAGEGIDLVQASVSYTLSEHVENLTLTGSSSLNGTGNALDNLITGNGGSNVLRGLDGNDTLVGNAGNDTLDGGSGADSLSGGNGNDTYVVDDADDQVIESAGQGTDLVQASIDYRLTVNVENLTLTGGADLNGTGNGLANVITGNSGANLLDGGVGNDSLYGNAGDDQLLGGEGNDLLNGGAGADRMLGGLGNDTYVVDAAGDQVIESAGEGTDLVQSSITYQLTEHVENLTLTGSANIDGTGNDLANVITGNSGANLLDGGLGDDSLYGGAGTDTLLGGEGNDRLDGGSGADSMAGGVGDDTYVVDNAGDVVIENVGEGIDLVQASVSYMLSEHVENLTLTGSASINGTGNALDNLITGNGGSNVLSGLDGNDTLLGNAGNDTLDGGSGADSLSGGSGNDTYVVDDAGDQVIESAGQGTDLMLASIDYSLTANVENLTLTGSADLSGTGNGLANVITGNSGANVLDGGVGNDSLYGNVGDDQLLGGEGIDLLDGGTGVDRMLGGLGNDTYVVDAAGDQVIESAGEGTDLVQSSITYQLTEHVENLTLTGSANIDGTGNALDNLITGNSGANVLDGGLGDDSLAGGAGSDTLLGGEGNDRLDGGSGADSMAGGVGDDTYVVDNAGDVVIENVGEGIDLVQASVSYMLSEHVENLTLTGSASINGTGNALDNLITGNGGSNVLSGLDGNDTLVGNAGNDTLDGGSGADSMSGGSGNDTYMVDDVGDQVIEGANQGTDLVLASIDYSLTANVENLTMTGSADLSGTGNGLANVITGNSGSNVLDGGEGADTLIGGAGDDTYIVDNDGDVVSESSGAGTDTVLSSVSHTLSDNVENLTLTGTASIVGVGNAQDNVLQGNGGDNQLLGGAGDDWLDGGVGIDNMAGGVGNDAYVVDNAGDQVIEAADEGIDTVQAAVSYSLSSNVENLKLTGSADIDGNGNALDNVISGNSGNNTLDGGAGNDRFVFGLGSGSDRIIDSQGLDVLRVASGLTANDLQAERLDDDLLVQIIGSTDTVILAGWFTRAEGVSSIAFDDGTVLDRQGMEELMNRPPVANSDEILVHEDGGPLVFAASDLLANDTDPNPKDVLEVLSIGESALGVSVVLHDGAITYDIGDRFQSLAAGQVLNDSFSYTISDSKGATAMSVVNVGIMGTNDAPVVASDSAVVVEDTQTSAGGNVLLNDHNIDVGDILRIAEPGTYEGVFGSLMVEANGDYRYVLANDSTVVQSLGREAKAYEEFLLQVTDGVVTVSSTLGVAVHGSNDAPILGQALSDQYAPINREFSWQVPEESFMDIDEGDALHLGATLADGSALPDWLVYDAETATFTSISPKKVGDYLDIRVTATDSVADTGSMEGSLSVSDTFRVFFSHGNQGLGNGQDAAAPGHSSNWNDGPGASLGNPGAINTNAVLEEQLHALVNAMSAFGAPAGGETSLVQGQRDQLSMTIAVQG